MKSGVIFSALVVLLWAAAALLPAGEDQGTAGAEKAIRETVAALTTAFNMGDATALTALWTPQGDYVGPRGRIIQGHEELAKGFEEFFALNKGVQQELSITSIRQITPESAVVDALVELDPPLQGPPTEARSTIVLVRREGRWLIESARDVLVPKPSNYDHLKVLDWMIGDWSDAAPASDAVTVESTCDWTVNKSFIIRKFTAQRPGRGTVAGTEVIGFDPRENQIRSWEFDSDGGFIEGFWTRDGNQWIVETRGVLQDGREVSAANVLTRIDDNTVTFRATDRMVDGLQQPDIPEVKIQRKSVPGAGPGEAARKQTPRETVLPPEKKKQ